MSLVAPVKEGKVQETGTTAKTNQETKTDNSSLDKQAFLSLLVAEMQNQDPLEPTTNTEYISQLATFSSLEEMQNMAKSYEISRSVDLVGQEVYLKNTNSTTGDTNYVHGIVDYVQMSGDKAYLSVNGQLYSIDDLDSVYDPTYSTAYNLAYNWNVDLNKLPALSKITESDSSAIEALRKSYDDMDDYQKSFVASDNVTKLEQYEEQLKTLKNMANNSGSSSSGSSSTSTDSSASTGSSSSSSASSGTTATDSSADTDSSSSEETSEAASAAAASSSTTEASNSEESSEELSDEQIDALTK